MQVDITPVTHFVLDNISDKKVSWYDSKNIVSEELANQALDSPTSSTILLGCSQIMCSLCELDDICDETETWFDDKDSDGVSLIKDMLRKIINKNKDQHGLEQ